MGLSYENESLFLWAFNIISAGIIKVVAKIQTDFNVEKVILRILIIFVALFSKIKSMST